MSCGLVIPSVQAAQTSYLAPRTIDTNSRESVISSFQTWLEPLLTIPTGWTGSKDTCAAGTSSKESQAATLSAVNYMRTLGGLVTVNLDDALSSKSQAAALMMTANDQLSHSPPQTWNCYTSAGHDGASHGNLFLAWGDDGLSGATGARSVVGYMQDYGEGNFVAGHRRWLMYSGLSKIGTGDTDNANSIYVVSKERSAIKTPAKWTSWPTAGFFPRELEPLGRWSLAYPGANFTKAKVHVATPFGNVRPTHSPSAHLGYGDNTITWDMVLPNNDDRADRSADYPVTVTISDIKIGEKTVTKEWTTTMIPAASNKALSPVAQS